LIAIAISALSVSAAPGLTVKVSAPQNVAGVDSLKVVTTVTNSGTETLKLVNDPNGPLSTFPANTFAITDAAGKSPKFTGAKVKFSPTYAASVNDVTVLVPGQSVEVTHDLEHNYNFSTTGEGAYTIATQDYPFFVVDGSNNVSPLHAEVETSNSRVSGKLVSPRMTSPHSKRATFVGCTTTRQSLLNTAASNAQSYASSASSYVNGITSGTTRYTTWFGTFDSGRVSSVRSHFNLIKGNSFASYTYDCACTDSSYAWVYPNVFGTVHLCNAFWNAPATGTDSKAGTLIHESSHFTANGGTNDYAYGQTACKSLATSSPGNAVFNADSHEYFAENTPFQS
jgi:peptidyl-Lys metalloendopeptidase